MNAFHNFFHLSLLSLVRDRLLHVIGCISFLLFLVIPSFSMFSMRQVQELSISLSLSSISFILLLITLLAGSSSIWRDVEKRYTASVLALPISRISFVLGKFCAVAAVIACAGIVMTVFAWLAISISAARYPSTIPLNWLLFVTVVFSDVLKYMLLLAFSFLFSAVSTSFFFPFFVSIALYLAGSASQEVYEFVGGEYSRTIPVFSKYMVQGLYYILPNFGAFNLKVYAIYGLQLSPYMVLMTALYGACYTGIVLWLAAWGFSRREIS